MLVKETKPRFLIFGIDGASFDLIDRFIAAGQLPNFSSLLKRATSAPMTCTWPAHTAPGWATLVSGRYPGRHGIYQFFDTQNSDYSAKPVGSLDFGCSTIWDWLSLQGWSLGVVNVPMSHPPRELPGYQITWPLENTLRYCSPRTLLGELARSGAHFQSDLATMYQGNLNYIDDAIRYVDRRLASLEYLLRHRPVDALMIVFTEIDRVCHHYWHFLDQEHPRYEMAPDYLTRAIERIYIAVDAALGRALELVPDDCTVVVVSDHGFGPGHHMIAVHRLLERVGLLATKKRTGAPMASWFYNDYREVDWQGTSVYMPVPGSSALNLNLRGRQRWGIVHSSERARMIACVRELLATERTEEGQPIFNAVLERDEAYSGPLCEYAPDILLIPRNETSIVSPTLEGPMWQPSYQTGLHRNVGMWIHASSHVKPGRLSESIRIVDVVPTLLADVGADYPALLDGRVLNIFSCPTQSRPPIDIHEATFAMRRATSHREDLVTLTRLREMGYL